MPDSLNDIPRPRRGQPLTLTCQRIEPDEVPLWRELPGFVGGYRDFDGNPIPTTLDELTHDDGGDE